MTAQTNNDTVTPAHCWCCGSSYSEDDLVRLGRHPEVAVCLGCARWLKRRAAERVDARNPSPAARIRTGIGAIRGWVIRRGWHQRGPLGALLRRIDRYLP